MFANGAVTAAMAYAFNQLGGESRISVSEELQESFDKVVSTPAGSAVIGALLEDDRFISLTVSVDETLVGPGRIDVDNRKRSPIDTLLGRDPRYSVHITVNPNSSQNTFFDTEMNPFSYTVERAIAHELGHAYTRTYGRGPYASWQSRAIEIENAIYTQLRPNAPIRHPTYGHGRFRPGDL